MQIIDVHTPGSSFSVTHSLQQENLQSLYDKLSRKINNAPGARGGQRVNAGWIKYQHGDSFWNLDDASTFSSTTTPASVLPSDPNAPLPVTLHLSEPSTPLPQPPEFQNPKFYAFLPKPSSFLDIPRGGKARSVKSNKSKRSRKSGATWSEDGDVREGGSGVAKFVRDFHQFHSENGVRTVKGSIGPVPEVRMLLKQGYRHVYISRAFAKRNGFIPDDATPGFYGYTGLISIGEWPITLGKTTTRHTVYLSEESHFDVVLGRAFMERRSVKTDLVDLTSVICMDTGEKVDCEVVIIRDGKGEYVTVT
ncbi:hypothetical protein DL93DRAFT_2124680 [Clavulina sp. PMI_390]|nr:hypothetical protein DL93DRAFT_2124680 [Clavulina sp. PMI_390]